jgi:hypothetical protein
MKNNGNHELQSALKECEAIQASLLKEEKLLKDSAAELNSLQRTIDISDVGQLQRMTILQTISQVGSPRRAHRHKENETALKALVATSQSFVSKVFAPRLRDLNARAVAKVEGKVKQHFPDKEALQAAVQHSTELLALAPILRCAVIRDYGVDGAIRQAELLLEAWSDADAFEQQHLS